MKKRQNHRIYIEALRRMTSDEKLGKTLELSELCRGLFLHGLRRRFPDLPKRALMKIYLERLSRCHNRNY